MRVLRSLLVSASIAASVSAQSSCFSQQYNPLPGFPASNSGCYPTNYYAASDLGSTSPSDAQTRCSQQCTNAGSQCGSYVAQVNKAADSNNYSGTCFFFTPFNPPTGLRSCVDTAYLLIGFGKDNTNACFSSSTGAATIYCSAYLSIPMNTVTATSTPPVVSQTITATTSSTITITITASATATMTSSVTSTVTSTTTILVARAKVKRDERIERRAAAAPACLSSNTPASRLSAACSCLSITPSITTTTMTLKAITTTTTSTTTIPVSVTQTITVTSSTVTSTSTSTVTVAATVYSTCPATAPNLCNNNCVDYSSDRRNCGSCGAQCPGGYQCAGGTCSQPAPCSPPSGSGFNVYYCNSANTCICYLTVDGRGYCDSSANGNSCGLPCTTSFDCPNGGACETALSSGCPTSVCSNAACPAGSRKLLRSTRNNVEKKSQLKKNMPPGSS